ncbi:hypothetical protein [Bacillus phage YungSlug]|nr:hypothetical protein [Bacillus phage YungSlug]
MSTTTFRILVLKGLMLILKRVHQCNLNSEEHEYLKEVQKVINDESKPKSKLM